MQPAKRVCLKCGRENEANDPFCSGCGAPLQVTMTTMPGGAGAMPPTSMERPLGVTIIGIFQILGGVIFTLFGAFVSFFGAFGLFVLAIGVITLLIGIAFFSGQNWARILMMIAAVLDIISIVGIIWGIIILVYLRRRNVVAWFNRPRT